MFNGIFIMFVVYFELFESAILDYYEYHVMCAMDASLIIITSKMIFELLELVLLDCYGNGALVSW